ncbi:MAG: TIM barrel protein [Nanoarchaeota archaeon]
MIRIGPAGIGGVKEIESNFESFSKNKIKAAEAAFTYGVYLKENEAVKIGKLAKKLNIKLSVHAPYWINLNSGEKIKVKKSKERILKAGFIGEKMGATHVVFHPGYYGKKSKEETYENIKNEILDLQKDFKKWKIKLAPETTGKVNVFGSIEEILQLVKDTKCSFCLDFAHLLARSQGKMSYGEMLKQFKKFKHIHAHFSGIEYSAKGERRHKKTPEAEIKKLMKVVKGQNITVINESPDMVNDVLSMISYLK